mmetsp:Transcript_108968/g.305002  ORF Transcript_108968/g.305002 Transcript_108968/m.305002 type:complete len:133 (-) Transcript_108968:142-540(-)
MGAVCCSENASANQQELSENNVLTAVKQEVVLPAVTQAKAEEKASPKEWTITLNRTEGSSLGIDVDLTDQTTLQIEEVHDNGLVVSWNKAHPDMELRIGDRVVCVNGTSGSASALVDASKKNAELQMVVRRG